MSDGPTDVIGEDVRLWRGDALEVLPTLPDASVDAVVTDPPYAEIDRPYGRLTEVEWFALMNPVVEQCRRVLKASGSAVFILQSNSEYVGRMRGWLFEFMAKWYREWNCPQDAYWWNPTAPPTVHCHRTNGLMRPSLKACVWLGAPDCYRNQDEVLWEPSEAAKAVDRNDRAMRKHPSGQNTRPGRCAAVADERGGVTPFNLIPIANTDSSGSAGANGHGAGTPFDLCSWWVRYICPPGGTVLDPFLGSGTTGLATRGRNFIGIERDEGYYATALRRLQHATGCGPGQLFGAS